MSEIEVAFIRGFTKSGTNWLCNILNLHNNIKGFGEFQLQNLHEGFYKTLNAQFGVLKREPNKFKTLYYQFVKSVIKTYCINKPNEDDIKIVIDRTAKSLESAYIPNCKYFYIYREGKDVLISWTYHCLRMKILNHPHLFKIAEKYDLDLNYFEKNKFELLNNQNWVKQIANKWSLQVLQDFNFMDTVKKNTNDKSEFYIIKYEDLYSDTEKYKNEFYQFLNLPINNARNLIPLTKPNFDGRATDNSNFYRSGKKDVWIDYFNEQQIEWYNEASAKTLKILNMN